MTGHRASPNSLLIRRKYLQVLAHCLKFVFLLHAVLIVMTVGLDHSKLKAVNRKLEGRTGSREKWRQRRASEGEGKGKQVQDGHAPVAATALWACGRGERLPALWLSLTVPSVYF